MMRTKRGTTLIEILMYTAFVGVILGSMTLLANATFTVQSKLRASITLDQGTRFAVARITSLVAGASGITTPSTGTSSSTLVLSMPTALENPTTITLSGGTIYLTQGATGTVQALTSEGLSFSTILFTRVSSTAPSVRIEVGGVLRDAHASYGSITVTSTASVRR